MAMGRLSKPVVVKWIDSSGPAHGYWITLKQWDHTPAINITRGFLIKKTKQYIVIASSLSKNGPDGGLITIPRCAIKKLRTQ